MAGVAPESTTTALAAEVPVESGKRLPESEPHTATISSAAPDASTAQLAKEAFQQPNKNLPGSYPETPAKEASQPPNENLPGSYPDSPAKETEQFSVNPIPASSGIGNPITLKAGEKVPEPATISATTVQSTVRTDPESYEKGASAPTAPGTALVESEENESNALTVPPVSKDLIPESSLPMGELDSQVTDTGVTIQSSGPMATTAQLAAAVPLEKRVKDETSAPESPAAYPATDEYVPDVVRRSIDEAHKDPEAAANHEAVEEKEETEEELLQKISPDNSVGTPAPTTTATITETAPAATGVSRSESADSRPSSPLSKDEPSTDTTTRPYVTTGVADAKTTEVSAPPEDTAASPPEDTAASPSVPGAIPEEQAKETEEEAKEAPVTTATTAPATAASTSPASAPAKAAAKAAATGPAARTDGSTQENQTAQRRRTNPQDHTANGNGNGADANRKKKHRGSGFFGKIKEMFK